MVGAHRVDAAAPLTGRLLVRAFVVIWEGVGAGAVTRELPFAAPQLPDRVMDAV